MGDKVLLCRRAQDFAYVGHYAGYSCSNDGRRVLRHFENKLNHAVFQELARERYDAVLEEKEIPQAIMAGRTLPKVGREFADSVDAEKAVRENRLKELDGQ